ncbi:MAG: diguanylate cyclase [Candidatus Eremiobacteraeota bacterium]|nr:diguanylate cyclase [Candidatus Eremiobacteraeota bacterium]
MDATEAAPESAQRLAHDGEPPTDEEVALGRFFLYFMLPLWFAPSVADWWWHKTSDIEHTAGTHESLTHLIMMSVVGGPLTLALLCDINALVLVAMLGGFVAHEGVSYWDVRYAKSLREITTIEQHTHSYLEILPLVAAAVAICLRPKQFAAIFGRGDEPARWRIEPKRIPLTAKYITGIVAGIGAFVVAPYAEEFVRCMRVNPSLAPRRPASD